MNSRLTRLLARTGLGSTLILFGLGTPSLSHAVGTIAGTDIANTASVSYEVSGTPQTTTSNTVTVTVAEVLDVDVTLLSGPVSVIPGATTQELLFVVTNTGNGNESFTLAIDNALAGDDFDPVASTPAAIYFDTDASGDFSASDTAYDPGVNDPLLAPDASIDILLVNDIPAGLADGLTGLSELGATAVTGSGDPGDRFPGAGDAGVDAVVGTTRADAANSGQYVIGNIELDVVKSATIVDPFGGTDPVPGAEITYRIVVTPSGSQTATNVVVADPIPADTTYLANSITLNGSALTDAADADAGTFTATPDPEVSVSLGDLTAASGVQTVEFTVTID
ncbi:MAG: DUF11 domain-containing protein [Gammaproteobacteria bacterium]